MLFKQRLHVHSNIDVTFARRGKSDRTDALRKQLEAIQAQFTSNSTASTPATLTIKPANSCDVVGLQIADYALWALQSCYESYEARFLHALWPKGALMSPLCSSGLMIENLGNAVSSSKLDSDVHDQPLPYFSNAFKKYC
jgi:hypothetical protein